MVTPLSHAARAVPLPALDQPQVWRLFSQAQDHLDPVASAQGCAAAVLPRQCDVAVAVGVRFAGAWLVAVAMAALWMDLRVRYAAWCAALLAISPSPWIRVDASRPGVQPSSTDSR